MLLKIDELPTLVGCYKVMKLAIVYIQSLGLRRLRMRFNEKLINLRKTKGLSQEELGIELKVSRQTISKWESCQSYPDFQRLVLLSDFFGCTLDELVKNVDVQDVRRNINNEKLSSIYDDVNKGKQIVKGCLLLGIGVLVFLSFIFCYGLFFM